MRRGGVSGLALILLLGFGCQPAVGATVGAPSKQQGDAPSADPGTGPFDPATLQVRLDLVTSGLREPTHVTPTGDASGRLFVTERAGRIQVVRDGRLLPTPFLDIRSLVGSRGDEQGLLSVAFHPRYSENGRFFVYYTDPSGTITIARYEASPNPDVADPGAAAVLLRVAHSSAPNHNGGLLAFGPDGYLYAGLGDGGGAGDQFRNAQSLVTLLGKLLRIDVDSAEPYGIPPSNPFVDVPSARPEIWAYGLRNPWRYAFDRANGDLYIGDVGQNRYEEIDLQAANSTGGTNYGWPILEGFHCYPVGDTCDRSGFEPPIAEYDHRLGCSISGGFVYRGIAAPRVQGVYFYADFCSGRLWALDYTTDGTWRQAEVLNTHLNISTFGEDEAGEIYIASLEPGALHRLVFS
ncbi:MAG: glucose dehydrogenase [Chloroflexi bacterium]|nr:glucose dehydrogenase [Chloroflexota bacterium]